MSVRSEKSTGFVQPFARIAVTVPGVVRGVGAVLADVVDRGLQCMDKLRKRGARPWFGPVLVQPAAGAAKVAVCANAVVRIEAAREMTISEVDLAFDKPARIGEKGYGIPRYGACLVARKCSHEYPQMRLTVRLDTSFPIELSGVLLT